MPTRRLLVTVAALALVAGCATAPTAVVAPSVAPFGEQAGRGELIIRVASNGCTAKADFAHYVERKAGGVTLAFGRKRLDTCKSFAMGQTSLVFTYDELGLSPDAPIFLLNPLVPWTGPGS
jgi:hypothetical protein